jgi:predicted  nucleic acid-binding Zn-ribbon protein
MIKEKNIPKEERAALEEDFLECLETIEKIENQIKAKKRKIDNLEEGPEWRTEETRLFSLWGRLKILEIERDNILDQIYD